MPGNITRKGKINARTFGGAMIRLVETHGRVPASVRDALSWLPHPVVRIGRGKKGTWAWFWESPAYQSLKIGVPSIQPPDSERCNGCIFQEPRWSQGYAGCSHSWLHDRDGDCHAFFSRDEFLKMRPDYAAFCRPVRPIPTPSGDPAWSSAVWKKLSRRQYWSDGTRYCDFRPSLNLPSGYYASVNFPAAYNTGLYGEVERERLRRFMQWARDETSRQGGVYQSNMFLNQQFKSDAV